MNLNADKQYVFVDQTPVVQLAMHTSLIAPLWLDPSSNQDMVITHITPSDQSQVFTWLWLFLTNSKVRVVEEVLSVLCPVCSPFSQDNFIN